MRDVQTESDVRAVVDAFYADIEADEVIGRFFRGVDLPAHLPKMYAFWSNLLFQTGGYRGSAFAPHALLQGLEPRHFDRWLGRFERTVDALFRGERADFMKLKASQIASIFQMKMGMF